jgi:hypothetical protein
MVDPNYIASRAILSTQNDCMDRINMKMINWFKGDEMVYHSFDCAVEDPHNYYPPDFLNTLTPNRLLPHLLKLNINSPSYCLETLTPQTDSVMAWGWWFKVSKGPSSMQKLCWVNMLERGFSCQGSRFVALMIRCSLFSSKGSSSLLGSASQLTRHKGRLSWSFLLSRRKISLRSTKTGAIAA